MLLPDDLLEQVHFYHLDCDNTKFVDHLTIFFTPWYKVRRQFVFHRFPQIDSEGLITYLASGELVEIVNQLRGYIFGYNEDIEDEVTTVKTVGNILYLNPKEKPEKPENTEMSEEFTEGGSPPDEN